MFWRLYVRRTWAPVDGLVAVLSLARFEKVLKAEDQKMLAFAPLEPLAWRLLS